MSGYLWCYGVWLRNEIPYTLQMMVLYGSNIFMSILSVVAIVRFPSLKYGDRLLIFGFLSYALYNQIYISTALGGGLGIG